MQIQPDSRLPNAPKIARTNRSTTEVTAMLSHTIVSSPMPHARKAAASIKWGNGPYQLAT